VSRPHVRGHVSRSSLTRQEVSRFATHDRKSEPRLVKGEPHDRARESGKQHKVYSTRSLALSHVVATSAINTTWLHSIPLSTLPDVTTPLFNYATIPTANINPARPVYPLGTQPYRHTLIALVQWITRVTLNNIERNGYSRNPCEQPPAGPTCQSPTCTCRTRAG
jgi:hypothetical protein